MNFLEYALKNKIIKNLEDANIEDEIFINEYIDFILEQGEKYNNYVIGDLVFVKKYKYQNGQNGSFHIFLIVDIKLINSSVVYLGMILSSKIDKIRFKYNELILKNEENNLKKDSIIKTDAIYKIFTKNILLKIGNIDKTKVEIYKSNIINNIKLRRN